MTPAEQLSSKKKIKINPLRKVWDCRIKDLRYSLGLTLKDVSEGTGLSPNCIHQLETGYVDPCLTTVAAITSFFGKQWSEIWLPIEGGAK